MEIIELIVVFHFIADIYMTPATILFVLQLNLIPLPTRRLCAIA